MARTEGLAAFKLRPGERIAVGAGAGRLPVELVERLVAMGHRPFVVLIEGEADAASPVLTGQDHWIMPLEHIGKAAARFRREGVTHLVMAGGVSRRLRLRSLRPSLGILHMVPRVAASLARGDDNLLRAIVRYYEGQGITVVGAHDIMPDLLAPPGVLTTHAPKARDRADLKAAAIAARAIGALDIGQAAIAIGGRAVALEGIEGTDGLLQRTVALRKNGRIAGTSGGVLVKCAKPSQELRADLPTIGAGTVELAHAAGLAGIGIEADRSIVLDMGAVVSRADELGLFVIGLVEEDCAK
ncbi:MAG: UDP-2,3-diacylglucosamine diphosphatase LpxI [Pseudomonadota bacterium]